MWTVKVSNFTHVNAIQKLWWKYVCSLTLYKASAELVVSLLGVQLTFLPGYWLRPKRRVKTQFLREKCEYLNIPLAQKGNHPLELLSLPPTKPAIFLQSNHHPSYRDYPRATQNRSYSSHSWLHQSFPITSLDTQSVIFERLSLTPKKETKKKIKTYLQSFSNQTNRHVIKNHLIHSYPIGGSRFS